MPIDPNIALSYRPPKIPDAADMVSLQNLVNQGQLQRQKLLEEQRQQQVRGQVQKAQSDPEFYDAATHKISLKGIRTLDGIEFGLGQHALRDQEATYARDLQTKAAQGALDKQFTETVDDVNKRATEKAAALEARGVRDPNILNHTYSDAWQEELDQAKAAGRFSSFAPDEIERRIDALKKNVKPYYEARARVLGLEKTIAEPGKKEEQESKIAAREKMAEVRDKSADLREREFKFKQDVAEQQRQRAKELLDDETLNFRADQYLDGDKSVRQGYARNTEMLAKFDQRVAQRAKEKGISAAELAQRHAEYAGRITEQRTLGTRGANLKVAGAELDKFAEVALEASKKVGRTGFVPLNKLARLARSQWSADQSAYEAANRSVINAFAQLASRGVPTVHNTEEAEVMLNTAQSQAQYEAVLKQLRLEAKSAIDAVSEVRKQTRDEATGKPSAPGSPKTMKWGDLK